MPHHRVTLMQV